MWQKYFKNILISIDQFFNTLAGGDPDMTISARLGRNYKGSLFERFVDWIFSCQCHTQGHCENADEYEQDEGKDAVLAKNKDNNNLA